MNRIDDVEGRNEKIEQVVREAEKYGLEIEVEESARIYIKNGYEPTEAYINALWDWVK